MSDVTHILDRVQKGDTNASEELLPLVYDELRKLAAHRMAGEAAGHTLQPTALVHEAWLRLVRTPNQAWHNRAHFFRTAAECMRRILIDNARRKLQIRHGGGGERIPLDDMDLAAQHDPRQLLHVHEALDRLAVEDATKAEIVKLRFFAGLENREIAELLDISERTVERAWSFAKAWLLAEFSDK
ncbi:MAG: sigma-70 family RNA polymerase sigma factor [Limisphaerales bacterium]